MCMQKVNAKSAGFIFLFDEPFYNVRTEAGMMHSLRAICIVGSAMRVFGMRIAK